MAKNDPKAPQSSKPQTPPPGPKAEASAAPAKNGEAKTDKPKKEKKKRTRVRLVSPTVKGFWCRMFTDVMEKHGKPLGPDGQPLEVGKAVPFGVTSEDRAAKKAAKEAEKARVDAMSDEEKLAYAAERRKKRQEEQTAKKEAERQALIAQIKKDIAEGRL